MSTWLESQKADFGALAIVAEYEENSYESFLKFKFEAENVSFGDAVTF